jgi:hypothetical protein
MYERHGHVRGRKRSATHYAWTNMISRCINKNRPDYHRYGGRGITVCDAWRNSFSAFLADMGPRPDGTSLDRIDNNCGYEPGNCRWATKHEQMQNTSATRRISFRGETMGINAWASRLGINKQSLSDRLRRGWPLEKALTMGPTR